jgi:hypothetical protein
MLWTLEYGMGKVFVTVLGHDGPAVAVMDPKSWTQKWPCLRWSAALKMEESQCPVGADQEAVDRPSAFIVVQLCDRSRYRSDRCRHVIVVVGDRRDGAASEKHKKGRCVKPNIGSRVSAACVNCSKPLPSALISQTPPWPLRSDLKAMRRPSRDHTGHVSRKAPFVSWRTTEPSDRMAKMCSGGSSVL